jgi:aspartate carbamoyltransferase regulatory subunit
VAAVDSSYNHHFFKHKEIQIRKCLALKDHHQYTKTAMDIQGSEKFVINISERVLTESELSVLKKGLNLQQLTVGLI